MVDRSEYIIDQGIAEGMEALLADVIRKYPILYDKNSKLKHGAAYNGRCDTAWNKISDELNLEVESCKSLWSCMKQKFIKHRKRLDNDQPVSSWPTYDVLHKWLNEHVKKRRSRQDHIKRLKMLKSASCSKSNIASDSTGIDEDDDNEEWTEIMEDKNTMVKIQLKRKLGDGSSSDKTTVTLPTVKPKYEAKKKFNIQVVSDNDTEDRDLIDDEDIKTTIKNAEIVVVEEKDDVMPPSSPHIELIELKEPSAIKVDEDKKSADDDVDKKMAKIEQFLTNCVRTIDRCNIEAATSDSNDAFGKYIASMIRELSPEKRIKTRLNILQYASQLIANEINTQSKI